MSIESGHRWKAPQRPDYKDVRYRDQNNSISQLTIGNLWFGTLHRVNSDICWNIWCEDMRNEAIDLLFWWSTLSSGLSNHDRIWKKILITYDITRSTECLPDTSVRWTDRSKIFKTGSLVYVEDVNIKCWWVKTSAFYNQPWRVKN